MAGPPRSRALSASTAARLPPELSPPTATDSNRAANHSSPAHASSTAAGKRVLRRQPVIQRHHRAAAANRQGTADRIVRVEVAHHPAAAMQVEQRRLRLIRLVGVAAVPERTGGSGQRAVFDDGDRLWFTGKAGGSVAVVAP